MRNQAIGADDLKLIFEGGIRTLDRIFDRTVGDLDEVFEPAREVVAAIEDDGTLARKLEDLRRATDLELNRVRTLTMRRLAEVRHAAKARRRASAN